MKILIGILVLLPTSIAGLLFALAAQLRQPQMQSMGLGGIWSIVCIIAGIILLVPLAVALTAVILNIFSKKKK